MEVAAITAGPVKNLTAIENVATRCPHAIIFGCNAINNPVDTHTFNAYTTNIGDQESFIVYTIRAMNIIVLN